MKVEDNHISFSVGDRVISINKGKQFCIGVIKSDTLKGRPSLIIRVDKGYEFLASLSWDIVVPFDEHFRLWLEEQKSTRDQYDLIKETHESIIANKGRRVINAE